MKTINRIAAYHDKIALMMQCKFKTVQINSSNDFAEFVESDIRDCNLIISNSKKARRNRFLFEHKLNNKTGK